MVRFMPEFFPLVVTHTKDSIASMGPILSSAQHNITALHFKKKKEKRGLELWRPSEPCFPLNKPQTRTNHLSNTPTYPLRRWHWGHESSNRFRALAHALFFLCHQPIEPFWEHGKVSFVWKWGEPNICYPLRMLTCVSCTFLVLTHVPWCP